MEEKIDSPKQAQFIAMRAAGNSYDKISKTIDISKPTLIKWSKELNLELENARALEMERLQDEFMLSRQQRLRILGTQLSQINSEILDRDLSEVPTWRLFYVQQKLFEEISRETPDTTFIEETETNNLLSMKNLFKKTDKWKG